MAGAPGDDATVRRGMRAGIVEGVLATASDNLAGPFLALYALSLGATRTQVGLVTAVPALLGSLLQIPAAVLTDRLRNRRLLMMIGTIGLRPTWLVVPILAYLFPGEEAIFAFLVFLSARAAIGSAAPAAWASVMADVVPRGIRGVYFANRNVLCNLAALVASVVAGFLVRVFGAPEGYHAVFLLAGLVGIAAAYTMSWFPDMDRAEHRRELAGPAPDADGPTPPDAAGPGEGSGVGAETPPAAIPGTKPAASAPRPAPCRRWQRALAFARRERGFALLVSTAVLWNFAVTLPQPLFPIYFVESLGGSEGMWGLVSAASLVMTVIGQRYWGPLADRFGNRNLMVASGIFAATIPVFWFLAFRPSHAIFVNAYGGFIWAGYNLAAFNLVLELTPDARRATYIAAYNGLVGLAQFAGPIAGGILADAASIETVLLAAAGLRLAGWLVFRVAIKAPAREEFRWRNYFRLPSVRRGLALRRFRGGRSGKDLGA